MNTIDCFSPWTTERTILGYFQNGGSLSKVVDIALEKIDALTTQNIKIETLKYIKDRLILCIECKENYYSNSGLIGLVSKVLSSIKAILFEKGNTSIDHAKELIAFIDGTLSPEKASAPDDAASIAEETAQSEHQNVQSRGIFVRPGKTIHCPTNPS